MKQALTLRTSQQQTLSPAQQQALKLLKLSPSDLEAEIQNALEENPLLERVESRQTSDSDLDLLQFATEPSKTLQNRLEQRIRLSNWAENEKVTAIAILHCLNDDGYFTEQTAEDLEHLLQASGTEVKAATIDSIRLKLSQLEPYGVGAKDLSERLRLLVEQLPANTAGKGLASKIVGSCLTHLANRQTDQIKKKLRATDDEIKQSIELITQLDPERRLRTKSDNAQHVQAELLITEKDGELAVTLNTRLHTKLRLNRNYLESIQSEQALDAKSGAYVKERQTHAQLYISQLNNRFLTLLKIGHCLAEKQHDFFVEGEQTMKPLVLRQLAEQLELHESTISRAVANKFLYCKHGIYPLKHFFSAAIPMKNGKTTSATAVRALIRELISQESKARPLSDQRIVNALDDYGHKIARRTVTKYRESMRIAPSRQRKTLL